MKNTLFIIAFISFCYDSVIAQNKEHSKLKVSYAFLESSKVQPFDTNMISLDLEAKIPSMDSINALEVRFLDSKQNILFSCKATVEKKNDGTKHLVFNDNKKMNADSQMKIKTTFLLPKDIYAKSTSRIFFVVDKMGLLTNRTYLRQR